MRYTRYQEQEDFNKKKSIHPVWRGIGCLLIILTLLISYGITWLVVPSILATGRIPHPLAGPIHLPPWAFKIPVISEVSLFIATMNNPWVHLITFIFILLILVGLTSMLYAILYNMIGPRRYSPMDAPPSRHKPKKYTR